VPQVETLILIGFVGLLLLLRFDAPRFGTAEWDDEDAGGWRTWLRRLSWYAAGLVLIGAVYWLHSQPISVLRLQMGEDRFETLLAGVALGAMGTVAVLLYAIWRYGEPQLPPLRRYPDAVLNCVGTAVFDEAVFRGILLGLLLGAQMPAEIAIPGQAVVYGLATRFAGRDRPHSMLVLSLAIALVGGWVTLQTGGIGAAILGHAVTRLAIFALTGHAGQLRPHFEEEDIDDGTGLTPDGWEVVSDRPSGWWQE
jgi:hypothetical protein